MNEFLNQYILYVIKQYYEKPKANAEAQFLISTWGTYADFISSFGRNFDLDFAEGDVLDLIGRILDLPRQVNDVVPASFFGFSVNPLSKGFSSLENELRPGAPFFRLASKKYTNYQLTDDQYRKFLKVKAAKNICSPYLASDEKISLQQVVFDAFDGRAYVVDGKDQTLRLYVSPSIDDDELRLLINLDILPRPITFSYIIYGNAEPGVTFGFSNNPGAKGFGSLNDPLRDENGGVFARFYNG